MQVITVIESHNVDGYYDATLFAVGTTDEQMAGYMDTPIEDFHDKYEVTTSSVKRFPKEQAE